MTPETPTDKAPTGGRAVRSGNPAARVLIAPIRFYQRFISPGLPATCRYYPTCSAYAVEALQIHGVVRGTWLALRRLGRCQPWSRREHFDPVPPLTRRQLRAQRQERQGIDDEVTARHRGRSGSASSSFSTSGTGAGTTQGEDQGRPGEPGGPAGSSPSGPRTAPSVPTRRDIRVPTPAIGTIDHPVRRRPA